MTVQADREARVLAILRASNTTLGVREIAERFDRDAYGKGSKRAIEAASQRLDALKSRGLVRCFDLAGGEVWEAVP